MDEMLNLKSWRKLDINLNSLSSLPDETLLTLVQENQSDVLEMISYYFSLNVSAENKLQMFLILQNILKVLPPNEKKIFICAGVDIWLSKVIPTVLTLLTHDHVDDGVLEVFEILCEELGEIPERCQSKEWTNVLENICNGAKYPKVLKNLLENGSQIWHRLWTSFIKLFNQEVTAIVKNKGTPLNSMLPVVETAFKMDTISRYRAFECWRELIENFARDINDSSISRRLKLLMVPLKVNNARINETAQAKFEIWWILIRKFKPRLGNFVKEAIILFLQFCFGKPSTDILAIPRFYSHELKMQCVEALVEMTGHVYCNGCTAIPKLDGQLLCKEYLFNYWSEWTFSMRSAVLVLANDNKECSVQQVRCMWKSFLLTISDLPGNNVRTDMVMGLLNELSVLVKECNNNNSLANLVFNGMILSSFDDEEKLKQLFRTIGREDGITLKKIISLMVDRSFTKYFESITSKEAVKKLNHVMDVLLDESLNSPNHIIQWCLKELPVNDNMLIFWTALAKNAWEFNTEICIMELCNMLLWPLVNMDKFTDLKLPALAWYTMYSTTYKKITKTEVNKQISKIIMSSDKKSFLLLCACLAVLKHDINENSSNCEKKVDLLQNLTRDLSDYLEIKEMFSILVDTLVILLNYVTTSINEVLAQKVLACIKNVLCESEITIQPIMITENLLESVSELFKIHSYTKYISVIEKELQQFKATNCANDSLNDRVNAILNLSTAITKDTIVKLEEMVVDKMVTSDTPSTKDTVNKSSFTKPKTPKRSSKKEPSIVSTVVEDGEEYVVVKSNWKFNPRKFTENQKEKLQKKREDIPALYQDLSQSQDEFKNTLWKTDSQDTSTSSKSAKGDDISMLKELLSSDVVPNIIETLLVDDESDRKEVCNKLPKIVSKTKQATTPKIDKSPRMALKDRVFRNVKMLTDKCAIGANKTLTEGEIHVDCNTPQSKPKSSNDLVSSAPPLLLADRPSRMKRLPKKFDNTKIFAVRKRHVGRERSAEKESGPRKSESNENGNQLGIVSSDDNDKLNIGNICQDTLKDTVEPLEQNENVNINTEAEKKEKSLIETFSNSAVEVNDHKDKTLETNCTKFNPVILEVRIENNIDFEVLNSQLQTKEVVIDKPISIKGVTCISPTPDEKLTSEAYSKATDLVDLSTDPSIIIGTKEHNDKSLSDMTQKTPIDKSKNKYLSEPKSSAKKSSKISRIEKALAIDMVEGHPLLKTDKRSTRKSLQSTNVGRRTSLADKINKAKLEKISTKTSKRAKVNDLADNLSIAEDVEMSENISDVSQNQLNSEELSCSEDIIESSQDSTFTTISVSKKTPVKELIVKVNKFITLEKNNQLSQNILEDSECQIVLTDIEKSSKNQKSLEQVNRENIENPFIIVPENENSFADLHGNILSNTVLNLESKDDTDFPENRTAVQDKTENNLTENMDTETFDDNILSNDVTVVVNEDAPIIISSEEIVAGTETQEIAEDDTLSGIPLDNLENEACSLGIENDTKEIVSVPVEPSLSNNDLDTTYLTPDEATRTITESFDKHLSNVSDANDVSSPFKDDTQRKQDFLNNTSEISPIKIVSPDKNKESPSPETSSDYVVIKLSTPVRSNGEPIENNESPEFFTEDKVSPDKRDQSPPRTERSVTNNTSPTSSLTLKKTRPQVRSGGRAAQMLGLCVPDKLNAIMNSERNESEEPKRSSPSNTQARRNLRLLYNTGTLAEAENENENENFLRFKRKLPSVDSSPSGPILKRKLADIEDDVVSPAGKRKRVSFHDPPVSTTIAVQKYIEPCGLRSPQSSAQKRIERQLRSFVHTKSPKRLDNAFKLDSVLNRAVESFTEVDLVSGNTEDTQSISLETTPAIEIVRASELNDKDPICPALVECKDTIDNIATKLSSTTAKSWLVKEFQGKIETIGDLAKMTELEVNRLCIKAPKVKTAMTVLAEYATETFNKVDNNAEVAEAVLNGISITSLNSEAMDCESLPIEDSNGLKDNETTVIEDITECEPKTSDIEVQTHSAVLNDTSMQTVAVDLVETSSQTYVATSHTSVQTNETGAKNTADIIALCLQERSDFVTQLSDQLNESSIEKLTAKLPFETITQWIIKRLSISNSSQDLNSVPAGSNIVIPSCQSDEKSEELLLNHIISIITRFKPVNEPKKMFLFYSKLLQKMSEINDEPA